MEGFDTVRALARRRHGEACAAAGGKTAATDLLDGATAITEIERSAVADEDPILCGAEAVLDPSVGGIFYKKSVSEEQAAFYQAHEFGHHFLDSATGACSGTDIEVTMPEERIPLGIQRVEGYGPRERRECQANVFAREFLLPCCEARRLFSEEKLSATGIAERLGVPLGLVHQQLAQALLVPEIEDSEDAPTRMPALDDSQKTAASAKAGPHLIEAGPGTGKTRTLVARIDWLLKQGVAPTSILVLTFSNKAAEELRERVAASAPDAAPAIWAGTLHAFGLEILRKFGDRLGLDPNLRVVDPGDALLLLEEELPSLPLKHYLRLYEPAFALRDMLTAISRAKDELIGPEGYRELGEKMLKAAGDDGNEVEKAEKAIEVAEVFAAYEGLLEKQGVVDFADLLVKPVRLLQDDPGVREALRAQYEWILVDEYQDVNRASGVLLKHLAGAERNVWAVGDARQSIYRFRGASPANIRSFEDDFEGAKRLSLEINYRSQAPVVGLFTAFARDMKASAGGLPPTWGAHRGDRGGEVHMEVATGLDAEAAGMASEIERRRAQGVPYRDQAVLCRSHTYLARFASRLEALGIPILYLGDLFERPEIRDLLALLSFTCEPQRGGLLRVATFPEYGIPLEDVRAVLGFAAAEDLFPLQAIARIDEMSGITDAGKRGLESLRSHLDFVRPGTPAAVLLFVYLFTRSRYLDTVLGDDTVTGACKRVAIYQLLQFATEYQPTGDGNPRQQLLRWIRRLETFGDEKQLRQMPSSANGIDAVRLLTVHASKGLEFSSVHLPALGTSIFPANRKPTPCPPPDGMVPEDPQASHAEEEECLFFVAMSRARDFLCLSRAERYSEARRTSHSRLLSSIAAHLPCAPNGPPGWNDAAATQPEEGALVHLAADHEEHNAEDLDQYIRCPRTYLYQRILHLSGARDDTAYVQFHRAVYSALRWMGEVDSATPVSREDAAARLDAAWAEIGPSTHPYATVYRDAADEIVERAVARRASGREILDADWLIQRPEGRIRLRPDHVEVGPDGPVVRRLRTGRPPKEIKDDIYALYQLGARRELDGARVEALFLTTDEAVSVSMTQRKIDTRVARYDNAISGIRGGVFPAKPDDWTCPRCPQYFICSAVPPPAAGG